MSPPPDDIRTAQAQAQAAALRRSRGRLTAEIDEQSTAAAIGGYAGPIDAYAGLVTRTIAFALDAALVNGVALLVGVAIGLGVSILHLPKQVETVIAAILGVVWVLWLVGYFAFFWSTTGQTPGDRVMRIRVIDRHNRGPLRPLRAAMRFGAVILAAIPLFAGILIMLWDDHQRCLQDRLARTIVVHVPKPVPPAQRLQSAAS
ncbi:MAG TPA: RDD family protein [Solirubrobacteraceae bacterium]|jgi:uncharacterized RDD family membrane protein YckC